MTLLPYLSYLLVLTLLLCSSQVEASFVDSPPSQAPASYKDLELTEGCPSSSSDTDEVSFIQRSLDQKIKPNSLTWEGTKLWNKIVQLPYHTVEKIKWTPTDRLAFVWFVGVLVLFDIVIVPRTAFNIAKHALVLLFMILVGATFMALIFVHHGQTVGEAWATCYLLEIAQSLANLFALHVMFKAFAVPKRHYVKVVTLGMYLAMVLRLIFFANLYRFGKLSYSTNLLVGIILLIVAYISFNELEPEIPPERRPAVLFWKWAIGSRLQDDTYSEDGALTTRNAEGGFQVTMLFVMVLVVGFVDLTLSLDNVMTQQFEIKSIFIMSTSCVFAMFALRSLFFIIQDVAEHFVYRQHCFAAVLVFCGLQMIASKWIVLPMLIPLLVIFMICAASLTASAFAIKDKCDEFGDDNGADSAETPLWSMEQAFWLCSDGQEKVFQNKAPLLENADSLSAAADKLNTGEAKCEEGFCIVKCSGDLTIDGDQVLVKVYYCLYKRGAKKEAQKAFGVKDEGDINVSAADNMKARQVEKMVKETAENMMKVKKENAILKKRLEEAEVAPEEKASGEEQ